MILYLIKTILCLALMLGIYHLVLEREDMHRFKRIYLLAGIACAFLIPFIPVGQTELVVPQQTEATIIQMVTSETAAQTPSPQMETIPTILGIYLLVALILFIRFGIQVFRLLRRARTHRNVSFKGATLVLINQDIVPYSFCNYIFISNAAYLNNAIEPELLTHELTHVKQRHSIDVLLVEFLRVVFWFNPVLPLLKRAMQANHEYLADQEVVQIHERVSHYQNLLLDKVTGNTNRRLASNLTFLLTKKRLKMMTKTTDKLRARIFACATLPLMVLMLMLFGKTSIAQSEGKAPEAEEQMTNEVYFKDAVFAFPQTDGTKIYKPYAALSDAEKNKIPPLPPLPQAAPNADNDTNPPKAPAPTLQPLPEGTVVELSKDGHVKVTKGVAPPPPPPPSDKLPQIREIR